MRRRLLESDSNAILGYLMKYPEMSDLGPIFEIVRAIQRYSQSHSPSANQQTPHTTPHPFNICFITILFHVISCCWTHTRYSASLTIFLSSLSTCPNSLTLPIHHSAHHSNTPDSHPTKISDPLQEILSCSH